MTPDIKHDWRDVDLSTAQISRLGSCKVEWEGVSYDSISEAVCSYCLQKYVPDWLPLAGKTTHVPIGFNKLADFLVHEVVVEFHPIALKREMEDRAAYFRFSRALGHCPKYWREELVKAMRSHLLSEYTRRRRWTLDHSGKESTELIVAEDSTDFYDKVVRRFCPNPPRLDEFRREWNRAMSKIAPKGHRHDRR